MPSAPDLGTSACLRSLHASTALIIGPFTANQRENRHAQSSSLADVPQASPQGIPLDGVGRASTRHRTIAAVMALKEGECQQAGMRISEGQARRRAGVTPTRAWCVPCNGGDGGPGDGREVVREGGMGPYVQLARCRLLIPLRKFFAKWQETGSTIALTHPAFDY